MISYVCGFLFAHASGSPQGAPDVLLIRKNRPRWQAGMLNGVGGHVEPGETPAEAMRREFLEEAGVGGLEWSPVALLAGGGFEVHFYASWTDRKTFDAATALTDEQLVRISTADLAGAAVLPNLRVLIPLALDDSGIVKPVVITDSRPVAA